MTKQKQGFVQVLKPGICSVQDKGRFGYLNQGIPQSGFMNGQAANLANSLLGNNLDCACLEWAYLPPKLSFSENSQIAITGSDVCVFVNSSQVKMNKLIIVNKSDVLHFKNQNSGIYGYIAIKGGFQTEKVLNSFSWSKHVTKYTFLKKSMKLPFLISETTHKHHCNMKFEKIEFQKNITIEALPGPEFYMLAEKEREQLVTQPFQFLQNSNRMGIRLNPNFNSHNKSIISSPVLSGTVQWTSSGQLIILMKEAQTIGGYPRILYIPENHICKLFLRFYYISFNVNF